MIYLNAFLFCGIICFLGEIVLEKTKLTPGHLNTILVIIGAILTGFGYYDKFIFWAGAGATVPITNFGQLLVSGALDGYTTDGFIGILKGLFVNASAGLSVTIISAFLVTLFFKPKN